MFEIGGCEEVWSSYWIAVCDSVSVAVVQVDSQVLFTDLTFDSVSVQC